MLKVIGTLESDLTLDQWRDALRQSRWKVTALGEKLEISQADVRLELEGEGFLLLHGSVGQLEPGVTNIKILLRGRVTSLQIDVFEEDGRMVNRITEL